MICWHKQVTRRDTKEARQRSFGGLWKVIKTIDHVVSGRVESAANKKRREEESTEQPRK
jgi:hypothetical protein